MRSALLRGMTRAGELVQRNAMLNLTTNRSVAFGTLRASMGIRVDAAALSVAVGPGMLAKATSSESGDPRSYGFFVERGRQPGRPPPARALLLWVRRKLGVGEADADRVAFLVARKIAARGVEPRPFLEPAVRGHVAELESAIARELDGEIAAINREGPKR